MLVKHILLIDDDEDDQEIFLSALQAFPNAVACTVFSNAKDALHQLVTKVIDTDLIFLDLNMPVMSGQQFLQAIKTYKTLEQIPVIVLSTTSHRATIEATKQLGAVDFITKPDKFTELVSVLQSIIG